MSNQLPEMGYKALEIIAEEHPLDCRLTLKGRAIMAAIECGLISRDEDGNYNLENFCQFWTTVEQGIIIPALIPKRPKPERPDRTSRTLSIFAVVMALTAIVLRIAAHFGWF